MLKDLCKQNVVIILIMLIISFTFTAKYGVACVIAYKGFECGYTIASLIVTLGMKNGILYSICLVILGKLIYIPTLFFLSNRSIKLYKELKERDKKRDEISIVNYLIIMVICFTLLALAALAETFICSNLFMLILNS